MSPSSVADSCADRFLHLGQFFLGDGDLLLGLGDHPLEFVDFLQRFEDFVGQHAAGHFVGGDLILEGLVLAVAGGGVEFGFEAADFVFAAFEQQLLLIGADARGLRLGLDFGQFFAQPGQVGLAGGDLLGATFEALAQIGKLPMDAVQLAQSLRGDSHENSSVFTRVHGVNRLTASVAERRPPAAGHDQQLLGLRSSRIPKTGLFAERKNGPPPRGTDRRRRCAVAASRRPDGPERKNKKPWTLRSTVSCNAAADDLPRVAERHYDCSASECVPRPAVKLGHAAQKAFELLAAHRDVAACGRLWLRSAARVRG